MQSFIFLASLDSELAGGSENDPPRPPVLEVTKTPWSFKDQNHVSAQETITCLSLLPICLNSYPFSGFRRSKFHPFLPHILSKAKYGSAPPPPIGRQDELRVSHRKLVLLEYPRVLYMWKFISLPGVQQTRVLQDYRRHIPCVIDYCVASVLIL